jgi:hypothetical protein
MQGVYVKLSYGICIMHGFENKYIDNFMSIAFQVTISCSSCFIQLTTAAMPSLNICKIVMASSIFLAASGGMFQ